MSQLDKIEERLENVFDNHLPHIYDRLGRVEGKLYVLMAIGMIISGLLTTIIVKG